MKHLLFLAIVGAVVLAGCADPTNDGDADTNDATTAAAMSSEQAESLVGQAIATLPEHYGFHFAASRSGSELMAADGTFDNATGANYVSLRGNAALFGGMRALADGISVYTSRDGAAYELAGLAIVQGSEMDELSGLVPSTLFTPDALLGELDADIRVTKVVGTTWKGQPATEVSFNVAEGAQSIAGKMVLLQDPARIVHLEGTLPAEAGMMSGALMSVDLLYGDDIPAVPAAAQRLVKLAYEIDAADADTETWTFVGGEIDLAELSFRVQDATADGDIADAPAVMQLAPADGTATAQGVTLAFDDKDADGFLSAGDTLTITTADDASLQPRVLLYDSVTGKHVTADFSVVMMAMMGGF